MSQKSVTFARASDGSIDRGGVGEGAGARARVSAAAQRLGTRRTTPLASRVPPTASARWSQSGYRRPRTSPRRVRHTGE